MKDEIRVCINTFGMKGNMGIPLLIESSPGAGKTSIVEDIAREMKLPLETVLLSVREPSEVAGIPTVQEDGVKFVAPSWAQNLAKAGKGIVFFDEINTAPPSTQAAALRVINDRVVGDLVLPPDVRMIAACNPVDEAAGGWELAPPLANRFCHLTWNGCSYDEWAEWMLGGTVKHKKEKWTMTQEEWENSWAKAKGLVVTFLKRNPGLLGPNIPKDLAKASKAWPSPRTWEMAARLFASCENFRDKDGEVFDNSELLKGTVGEAAAAEFKAFEFYNDLPDPEDLLKEKVDFLHDPNRMDKTMVVTMSLASYVLNPRHKELAPKAWEIIGNSTITARDVGIPAIRTLVDNELTNSAEAIKVLGDLDSTVASGLRISLR